MASKWRKKGLRLKTDGGDVAPEDIPYELGEELGRGATSVVYRGRGVADGAEVAVKVLGKKRWSGKQEERVRREVRIHAGLAPHPNIVGVHGVWETADAVWLVMDVVDGKELFEHIRDVKSLTEADAAAIMRQLVDAVAYLHSAGVAHRDLKPENVMLGADGCVKIVDFGLAKSLHDGVLATPCGTTMYMAPEVLQFRAYTQGVDVWALGVILYVMLCGFPPFYSRNRRKLFSAIKKAAVAFPSPFWDAVSADAKDLILACLNPLEDARISARDCLAHPWLASAHPPSSAPLATPTMLRVSRSGAADAQALVSHGRAAFGAEPPAPAPAPSTAAANDSSDAASDASNDASDDDSASELAMILTVPPEDGELSAHAQYYRRVIARLLAVGDADVAVVDGDATTCVPSLARSDGSGRVVRTYPAVVAVLGGGLPRTDGNEVVRAEIRAALDVLIRAADGAAAGSALTPDVAAALAIIDDILDAHPTKYWFLVSNQLELIDLCVFEALNVIRGLPGVSDAIADAAHLDEYRLNVASEDVVCSRPPSSVFRA